MLKRKSGLLFSHAMAEKHTKLYLFGTPGKVGGAATKIRHLVILLNQVVDLVVVLNDKGWMKDEEVVKFLRKYDVPFCLRKHVMTSDGGLALAICEDDFFTSGMAEAIKRKGLKLIFSNEMMFSFNGEAQAVSSGLIDKVL